MLDKWDNRFMDLAQMVSTWSKDPSTQVGAVLVSPDRTDICLGYNGFARAMKDDENLYSNRDTKISRIIHGEMNAILLAKKNLTGYTLYTWPCLSCDRCAVHVVQAGIVRVVAPYPTPDMKSRWEESLNRSRTYFREAGVEIVEYHLSVDKLIK